MSTVAALKNFRENLTYALSARKVSQRELARRVSTSHPYIFKILHGTVEPSLPQCEKIADAISVPLTDLLQSPEVFSAVSS